MRSVDLCFVKEKIEKKGKQVVLTLFFRILLKKYYTTTDNTEATLRLKL